MYLLQNNYDKNKILTKATKILRCMALSNQSIIINDIVIYGQTSDSEGRKQGR